MKIKLSDFILENSVNESDIIDIEFESLRAKIDVCCEMANYYEKLLNTQLIQEAMPAQQPPTVPTAQDLQQPSSGYTQDIDTDMPAGYKSTQSNNSVYESIDTSNFPKMLDGIPVTWGNGSQSLAGVIGKFYALQTYMGLETDNGQYLLVYSNNFGFGEELKKTLTREQKLDTDLFIVFSPKDQIQHIVWNQLTDASEKQITDTLIQNKIYCEFKLRDIIQQVETHTSLDSDENSIQADGNKFSALIERMAKAMDIAITNAKPKETPQQQETQQPQEQQQQQSQPQQTQQPHTQQQQPASALSGAIASMLVAVGLFAAKFLDYLKRHADTNLNLVHIKEAITASRKYIDLIYTMALNENFNDNDFNEFIKQFRDMMRIVETAASNASNNSAGQTFTQNARGLLNSEEVKDIESKIQQIQNARFQSQLQARLSGLSPQNLQTLNADAQKFKTDMNDLITSATNDIKSASYQQFKPAQQTQTSYQPQQQAAPTNTNTQAQQQGGQLVQMQ